MSDDRRKNLRTQGKYSDGKVQKSRDKKQRSSLESKDSTETKFTKRNSDGHKSTNNSFGDESTVPLKYEESSDYSFHQLQDVSKPTEIKSQGERILSRTSNGESRILYEPKFFPGDEADNYFDILYQTIDFDSRNIVIHGVEYPQPRLVAWFGPFPYTYSGVTLEAAEMPPAVLEIKNKVETYLQSKDITIEFNSVLINLYRNGKDSVAWHSDDEIMLGMNPTIASVSLGETRKFEMRPIDMKNYDDKSPSNSARQYLIHLTHGSLVVMTGCMQQDWQHRVPKEYHDKSPRINLTFRKVYSAKQVRHLVRKRRSFQRKSWHSTHYKKIRSDNLASPSSANSSYSRDANESFDEACKFNKNGYSLKRKSWHGTHENDISWYSRNANDSYDENCYSNQNLSIDSETDFFSGRQQAFDDLSTKTYVEVPEIKSLDDNDFVNKIELDFHESPNACKVLSVSAKENKSSSTNEQSNNNENNKSFHDNVQDTDFKNLQADNEDSSY